jgi:shikimate kinase
VELSAEEFANWDHKCVTLLGMSGVGKTRISSILSEQNWFHYSGDYRIGTQYLDEAILDNIKNQAMQVPFLHDLLESDSIDISNKITARHLKPVASYLGKLGDPGKGGLDLKEFKKRQNLHREAEIAAMNDVPDFINKAQSSYGCNHFINDVGGSLCELDDANVLNSLSKHTLMLYIKATHENEEELIQRAEKNPKPLYYREAFLDEHLALYMKERNLSFIALIDPDDFVRWVFPKLFYSRIPRYEKIAKEYGYTITTDELKQVNNENDFVNLITEAIKRK